MWPTRVSPRKRRFTPLLERCIVATQMSYLKGLISPPCNRGTTSLCIKEQSNSINTLFVMHVLCGVTQEEILRQLIIWCKLQCSVS